MKKAKIMATKPPASTEVQKGVNNSEKGQMMGSRIHIISFCSGGRIHSAETYAPTAMKPACPRENRPVKP